MKKEELLLFFEKLKDCIDYRKLCEKWGYDDQDVSLFLFDLTPKQEKWCECGQTDGKTMLSDTTRCFYCARFLKPSSELEEIELYNEELLEQTYQGLASANAKKINALIRNQRKLGER